MNTFGKIFVAIALIFAGTGLAKAQFSNPDSGGSFTLNFIGSMPVGDFSKATTSYPSMLLLGENNGNAVMGAGLGFKAGYQFGFGLGVFLSADAVWNQLNKDMRSRYDDISKTKPNYINFPLFLNLDYKCYFGNVFGL